MGNRDWSTSTVKTAAVMVAQEGGAMGTHVTASPRAGIHDRIAHWVATGSTAAACTKRLDLVAYHPDRPHRPARPYHELHTVTAAQRVQRSRSRRRSALSAAGMAQPPGLDADGYEAYATLISKVRNPPFWYR